VSKIVITGGAGFIGSHLAENLAREDYEIIIVDNLDSYYTIELKKFNIECVLRYKNARFIKGDICNIEFLKTVIDGDTEYVFHEAAQPGVRISVKDPFKANNVNVLGTLNVLKVSLDAEVERVISASSSSVYGKVEYLPFDEKHPTQPISPYGVSKLAAEHYCRVFYEVYGLPTVPLRYFTVYGPRMRPDLAISIFTKALLNNEPLIVFGDGNQTRDFTYIDDIINANIKLLKTSRADGKIINIGSGKNFNIITLIKKLEEITGHATQIIYSKPQEGDAVATKADTTLAKRLIGYKPRVSIEEGLAKFISWYKTTGYKYG